MSRYQLIALLFTAITCAAQPPTYTITEMTGTDFRIVSEMKLKDGRYLASGMVVSGGVMGFMTYDPATGQASRAPLQYQGYWGFTPGGTWVTAGGDVLTVYQNEYSEYIDMNSMQNRTVTICRYVPGNTYAERVDIRSPWYDAVRLCAATMTRNDIVYMSVELPSAGNVIVSYDKTLIPRNVVRLNVNDRLSADHQSLVGLSNGDLLLASVEDTVIKLVRFDADLNMKWSRKITSATQVAIWVQPSLIEKKDGSIVLSYEGRYSSPSISGNVIHHIDADGSVRASWIVPNSEWGEIRIQRMKEDSEGNILVISAASGGSRTRAIAYRIDLVSGAIDAYLHTAKSRPKSLFNRMTIDDAGIGRLKIRYDCGNAWQDTIAIAEVEWSIGGELPCDIVELSRTPFKFRSTTSPAWLWSVQAYTPTWNAMAYNAPFYDTRSIAVETYPCTSIRGTTNDSMVLAGEAYHVNGGDENPSQIRAIRGSNTGGVVYPSGVIFLSEDRAGRSKVVGTLSLFEPETGYLADLETNASVVTKLVPQSRGVVATQKSTGDSVVLHNLSGWKTIVPVPERARLLDVLSMTKILLVSDDSLYHLTIGGDVLQIPLSGRSAYVLDGTIIVDNPLGELWPGSQSDYYIGKAESVDRLYTLQNNVGGGIWSAARLSGPTPKLALFRGGGPDGRGVKLPASMVDSVVVFRAGAEEYYGAPVWAIGTIGNDACIIGIHRFSDSAYHITYQRIPREGVRLVPQDLEQRSNGTMLLWCEAITATKRSYIGIPTNSIGQTLCSTGWQKVVAIDSIAFDLRRSPMREFIRPSYALGLGRPIPFPVAPYQIVLSDLGSCGIPVSVALPRIETNVDVNPAVHDVIPSGLLPASVRSYTVRDVQGRIMRTVHDVVHGDIPTYDLPPGVYVMIMEHEAGKITTLPFMVMQR